MPSLKLLFHCAAHYNGCRCVLLAFPFNHCSFGHICRCHFCIRCCHCSQQLLHSRSIISALSEAFVSLPCSYYVCRIPYTYVCIRVCVCTSGLVCGYLALLLLVAFGLLACCETPQMNTNIPMLAMLNDIPFIFHSYYTLIFSPSATSIGAAGDI